MDDKYRVPFVIQFTTRFQVPIYMKDIRTTFKYCSLANSAIAFYNDRMATHNTQTIGDKHESVNDHNKFIVTIANPIKCFSRIERYHFNVYTLLKLSILFTEYIIIEQ